MNAKTTHQSQAITSFQEKKENNSGFTEKVKKKNRQLKNLLKTNLELLKLNDINTLLLF
ncbi:hypothetical protein GV828_02895 [Flavobacterium sp. NST-5]|uniref:Uncharacterized protein n=1 Tax=Flavobacterium ichthyis TaxID=2698827 RepID=A0ABW9Z8H7_9FLAO|nr:hypothetical protein [Flavobacterium ichthyis]NBL64144.1 hypothetical protein [Flavobacterium ichthyis]